jgi:hypothetical protein
MTKPGMQKPSPQFVGKLENELRMAYRAQYGLEKTGMARGGIGRFFKFFVPALSGALVLAIVVLNGKGGLIKSGMDLTQQNSQVRVETADDQFVAFTAGKEEEEIIADFESEELEQIDNEVRLIAEANF